VLACELKVSEPKGRLIVVIVLALLTRTAIAEKRLTVAQLEQTLTADIASHRSDADIVRQLAATDLTERFTETTLNRIGAHFIGTPVAPALQLLADRSAFLDPPPSELPSRPAPDNTTQQHILSSAHQYVVETLPRLPDFLATRSTLHYDDGPYVATKGQWPSRAGLHLVDRTSEEISIRDERESRLPGQHSAVWHQQGGLISGGEFGATLGMILTDTAQGKISWSHWEQTPDGEAAVFQYSVPRSASHFEVISSLEHQRAAETYDAPNGGGRGISSIGTRPSGGSNVTFLRTASQYHGSLWIDPATGTILRITIQADLKSESLNRAAILVQYGPVRIGDSTFICPTHSVAWSSAAANAQTIADDAPTEWLNDTLFTHYHRFASTVRILPGVGGSGQNPPAPDGPSPDASSPAPHPDQAPSLPQ
jgi:hypothetical protein